MNGTSERNAFVAGAMLALSLAGVNAIERKRVLERMLITEEEIRAETARVLSHNTKMH